MGTSAASEPLNLFIIVIYYLWPTYSFSPFFMTAPLGMVAFDHFMDLLSNLLNKYYKYLQIMLAKNLNFCAN